MKILLKKNGIPIVVYHQDYRIIDKYEEKVIDVIQDKNTNHILFSYGYKTKELTWYDNKLTKLAEVMVSYNIVGEKFHGQ